MSHSFYCTRCRQWMDVDVECPGCETEFELKENEMDETTDGGQGKHLQPFTALPGCIKCLNILLDFKLFGIDEEEYLELMCTKCGHSWNMETADAGKTKLLLEKEGKDEAVKMRKEEREKEKEFVDGPKEEGHMKEEKVDLGKLSSEILQEKEKREWTMEEETPGSLKILKEEKTKQDEDTKVAPVEKSYEETEEGMKEGK